MCNFVSRAMMTLVSGRVVACFVQIFQVLALGSAGLLTELMFPSLLNWVKCWNSWNSQCCLNEITLYGKSLMSLVYLLEQIRKIDLFSEYFIFFRTMLLADVYFYPCCVPWLSSHNQLTLLLLSAYIVLPAGSWWRWMTKSKLLQVVYVATWSLMISQETQVTKVPNC